MTNILKKCPVTLSLTFTVFNMKLKHKMEVTTKNIAYKDIKILSTPLALGRRI